MLPTFATLVAVITHPHQLVAPASFWHLPAFQRTFVTEPLSTGAAVVDGGGYIKVCLTFPAVLKEEIKHKISHANTRSTSVNKISVN